VAEAATLALRSSGKEPADIFFILAGISGAGEPALRAEIQSRLRPKFPKAMITVTSDLVLLLAAAGESPRVAVIAGTGSSVLGKAPPLKLARAGGFGPIIGDPGSAYEIGRKTVALCFQKHLNQEKFPLAEEICRAFECTWEQFVERAREQPGATFSNVFPIVAKAAESCDAAARAVLSSAAQDLYALAREVIEQLHLREANFFLAKTGGVFSGSAFFNAQFDQRVRELAPKVRIGPLPRPVAEAAAQLARDALTSPLCMDEN
jgi:N-acetylglucosamine kinase-like BadF-type ATPase